MFQKHNIFRRFFLLFYIIIYFFPSIMLACNLTNEERTKNYSKKIKNTAYTNTSQESVITFSKFSLYFISEKKHSNNKNQKIINNFLDITFHIKKKNNDIIENYSKNIYQKISFYDLNQKTSNFNDQSINLFKQLQREKNQIRYLYKSLKSLSKQKTTTENTFYNLTQKKLFFNTKENLFLLNAIKFIELQTIQSSNKLKTIKLKLDQLNTHHQKKISKLTISLLKKNFNCTNNLLYTLKKQLINLNHIKEYQTTVHMKQILYEQDNILPKSIKNQLHINHNLSLLIKQQTHDMNSIISKKKEIEICIDQVNQTFSNLIEQSQWVNKSPALGETLRSQVSELPKIPKFQQLDNNMAQLRAKRLQYQNHMNKIPIFLLNSTQDDGSQLTLLQKNILKKQLNTQRNLITSLLNNYDIQILELTKLKLSYEQFKNSLQKIEQATHRYLFWVADIHPITLSYPLHIYQDILKLFNHNKFHYQIKPALHMVFNNQKTLILTIFCIIIAFSFYFKLQYHYYLFLERTSKYVGKVNQDNFLITFYNISSSIFIALPIPILWASISYNLSHAWSYPIIVAIGDGMNNTIFMLWVFIISGYFASPKGLFIIHFGWSKKNIQLIFSKYYSWSVAVIIILTTALIVFNNYNNREFSNTLGRLCFLIMCIYLTFITNNLKNSKLPLYLNKHDSPNNIINRSLWNVMICAPIIAAISCAFGYLFVAQTLLARLELSLFVWIFLLIIYHIIRRWMFIQRRRIAFERAKKKRSIQLMLRTQNKLSFPKQLIQKEQLIPNENNKKSLDLDTISTQSLQLIRSIITLIALLLTTLLWSELRFAFSFLENITLWDVTSTIKGIENIQPITLNSFLTVIVVITITTITVRNLPSFLELTLLQYLNLTLGTKYAITTLTKYILILLGGLIGFSLIGIEWVKIQWLIAALGVGLGFGLQEIFANFISGLMILFEKPIRIGDTITIHNITGNVTRINIRATIITDWDHKEIIIPNKEFITKKFTNWSLSNTITRITLRTPIPFKINIEKMIRIIIKIIKKNSLALDTPSPEVYLIDLQQGFPMLEIRAYISNIKLRIPLRHQINMSIIDYYKKNGLELPYLPFYLYNKDTILDHSSRYN